MSSIDTKELEGPGRRMDDVYRWTRHVYDLSRPFFLLGRNRLVDQLKPDPGSTILEMGCGTGHNLIRLARRRPDLQLVGVDASKAMLEIAQQKINRAGLASRIALHHGYAESYQPEQPVSAVLFPYSLSMMPSPLEALRNATTMLLPSGLIHVVDFGDLNEWPRPLKTGVLQFLERFEVYPKPEVLDGLSSTATCSREWNWGRYCFTAEIATSASVTNASE
ncbi:MAG: class I SAM-dependent methyltransferase [Burkholderiaceae bacterium]